MKKVCILGTCRVSNLPISRFKYINPYMNTGLNSKIYITDNDIHIHTQPITYSTKLADARDILKYLKGLIYTNINPNKDIDFFNIFFRGFNRKAFNRKAVKLSGEIIEGEDNDYDMYIIEICSTREILFKTYKYGAQYYNKNLLWNIDIGEHNTIEFNKSDFEIVDTLENVENILCEINSLCKNKKILIIGPYLLKTDTTSKTAWGDIDSCKTDYVNSYRKTVQDQLKQCIKKYDNISYFDMTEHVYNKDILKDQYHFTSEGQAILTTHILNFINSTLNL